MSRTLHIQDRTAEDGPWYDEPALCMANSEQSFALAILDAAQAWATEHRPKLQYRLVARLTSNHEIPRAFCVIRVICG